MISKKTDNRLKRYVVDLIKNYRITDTKKAGCGDRLSLCVRRLEKPTKQANFGNDSSCLFVHVQ